MCRKNRHRIIVSLTSGLAFLFVFVLASNHPPQKKSTYFRQKTEDNTSNFYKLKIQ
jgi:hypothetical protein